MDNRSITNTVLLLGNGFDLHHWLPTKYVNYLHIVDFLINHYGPKIQTIGDVYGNEELDLKDDYIKICYEKNKQVYDNTFLDHSVLQTIIEKASGNVWYEYFFKSYNKDLGWIDFEKEIAEVIGALIPFLEENQVCFSLPNKRDYPKIHYISSIFLSIFSETGSRQIGRSFTVKEEYQIENPLGSRLFEINKEKVVEYLFKELINLSESFSNYLKQFVELPLESIKQSESESVRNVLHYADSVITFNYTDTCERLYNDTAISHIHGDLNNKIIFGVNPDETDELNHLNTLFITFKKYYQRYSLGTYLDYRKIIDEMENTVDLFGSKSEVYVIGHSLDKSDKDIIIEVFQRAAKISVFFHNVVEKNKLIKNIVSIFGKTGLDKLVSENNLQFIPM